jgi:hypothetical protein
VGVHSSGLRITASGKVLYPVVTYVSLELHPTVASSRVRLLACEKSRITDIQQRQQRTAEDSNGLTYQTFSNYLSGAAMRFSMNMVYGGSTAMKMSNTR